jgi:hypothetical protein
LMFTPVPKSHWVKFRWKWMDSSQLLKRIKEELMFIYNVWSFMGMAGFGKP